MRNLLRRTGVVHVAPDDGATTTYTLAGGTTNKNSVAVDTQGFKGATFLAVFGTNVDTGVFVGKLQGSADGSTNWTDITGATQTVSDASAASSNKCMAIAVESPLYRYLRFVSTRTVANTSLNGLFCLLDDNVKTPVVQLATAGQFASEPTYISTY
jgi:hypothetical protein